MMFLRSRSQQMAASAMMASHQKVSHLAHVFMDVPSAGSLQMQMKQMMPKTRSVISSALFMVCCILGVNQCFVKINIVPADYAKPRATAILQPCEKLPSKDRLLLNRSFFYFNDHIVVVVNYCCVHCIRICV